MYKAVNLPKRFNVFLGLRVHAYINTHRLEKLTKSQRYESAETKSVYKQPCTVTVCSDLFLTSELYTVNISDQFKCKGQTRQD